MSTHLDKTDTYQNLNILGTTAEETAYQGLNIFDQVGPLLPADVAKDRAVKAHYGMGDLSPGIESLQNSMETGDEDNARVVLAAQKQGQKQQQRNIIIQDIAKQRGGNLSSPQTEIIKQMLKDKQEVNKDTLFEKGFADKYINFSITNKEGGMAAEALTRAPKESDILMDVTSEIITRKEIFKKKLEDLETQAAASGVGNKVFGLLQSAIPGVNQLLINVAAKDIDNTGYFKDTAIKAIRDHFWSLPPDEMEKEYTKLLFILKEFSIPAALDVAKAMTNYSDNQQIADRMFSVVDGLMIGSPIALKMSKYLKSTLFGLDSDRLDPKKIYESMGDLDKAGDITVLKRMLKESSTNRFRKNDPQGLGREMTDNLPSMFDIHRRFFGKNKGENLSRERADILEGALQRDADLLTGATVDKVNVTRAPLEAYEFALNTEKQQLNKRFPNVHDMVLDARIVYNHTTNTKMVEFDLGRRDKTTFDTIEQTNTYMQNEAGLNHERFTVNDLKYNPNKDKKPLPRQIEVPSLEPQLGNKPVSKMTPDELQRTQEALRVAEGKSTSTFKTSKGSEYEVHPDGTTTRNKSYHPEHGKEDQGVQNRSEKTVYLSKDQANALAQPEGGRWRFIDHGDGTVSLAVYNSKLKKWGMSPESKNIKYSTEPGVGKTPLELWSKEDVYGFPGYKKAHFGNEISEVNQGKVVPLENPIKLVETIPLKEEAGNISYKIDFNGQRAGVVHLNIKNKEAKILDFIGQGGENTFDTTTIRNIIRAFQKNHPEIRSISGERYSGARTKNKEGRTVANNPNTGNEILVNLPKTKIEPPENTPIPGKDFANDNTQGAPRAATQIPRRVENLSYNEYKDAVSKGIIGPAEQPGFTRLKNKQTPIRGTVKDQLFHADQGHNLGYSVDDIAKHQAHMYALEKNPAYRKASIDAAGGKGKWPTLSEQDISGSYNTLHREYRKFSGMTAEEEVEKLGNRRDWEASQATKDSEAALDILNPPGMKIEQQGEGYVARITIPVDETQAGFRDAIMTTKNKSPDSVGNIFLKLARMSGIGKYTGAAAKLPEFQINARHVATHVPEEIKRVVVQKAQVIKNLRRESHDQLERVLNYDANFQDYKKGIRGQVAKSQLSLDKTWKEINGRFPTEMESYAYWSHQQLMDFDYMMRNLATYRHYARQGVEHFSYKLGEENTPWQMMRYRDKLPSRGQDVGVYVVENRQGRYVNLGDISDSEYQILKEMQEQRGFKAIQYAHPNDLPLKDQVGSKLVHFVLTKEDMSRPLPITLIDYRPGGHILYPQQWKTVQPQIVQGVKGNWHHIGDKTMFLHDTEYEAQKHAGSMETLRKMWQNSSEAELNSFIHSNLPGDKKYWQEQINKGYLNLEEPITYSRFGRSSWDQLDKHFRTKYPGIQNYEKSEYNLGQGLNMDFMRDRNDNPWTILNKGSLQTPVYHLEKAQNLDPFLSINKAVNNSIRTKVMTDYQISAVEQWSSQNKHLLDDPTLAEKNPYYAFWYPRYTTDPSKALEVSAAKNQALSVQQFLGLKGEYEKDVHYIIEKAFNWLQRDAENALIPALGNLQNKIVKYYNPHEMPFIKDPFTYMRVATMHKDLGFFNIPQFFIQAVGGATQSAALGGIKNAGPGLAAAFAHGKGLSLTANPDIIKAYGEMVHKFGYDKDMFVNAVNGMRSTGFDLVGGEYSMRSDVFNTKMFQGKGGMIMDFGLSPFTSGENFARRTAWFTAFREQMMKNPKAVIDDEFLGGVLHRANLMNNNMTRASNSGLQEGFPSVFAQFMTYNQRMLEMMWGRELTGMEKLKMSITYSALYGLPVGAGIGTGMPLYEMYKKYANDHGGKFLGMDIDERFMKFLSQGVVRTSTEMITGKDLDFSKYGPGWSSHILDIITGNKSLFEAVTGPNSSTIEAGWNHVAYPAWTTMVSALGGGQENYYWPNKESMIALAREVGSFENVYKGVAAANMHNYITKNTEKLIDNKMDMFDGIAMAIFGLKPGKIQDYQIELGNEIDRNNFNDKIEKLAILELKRAYKAQFDNDWKKSETHVGMANHWMNVVGNFLPAQIAEAYRKSQVQLGPDRERQILDYFKKGNAKELPIKQQHIFDKGKI